MSVGLGIVIVLVGGLMSGLYTMPMKYIQGWQWENTWLVYSVYGMLFLPWTFAFFLVTDVWEVYQQAEVGTLFLTLGFGALWGIGSTTFGLAVEYVGNSLAFSIILGLATSMGTAIPLLIFHFKDAGSKSGIFTWISLAVITVGLACLARAGALKTRDQTEGPSGDGKRRPETRSLLIQLDAPAPAPEKPWATGLLICVLSGVFSAGLNIAISFGAKLGDYAKANGTKDTFADNAAWGLGCCVVRTSFYPADSWSLLAAVGGGFLVNATFCIVRLCQNGTWGKYLDGDWKQRGRNFSLAALMGVMWMCANILYGIGGQSIGSLGKVVGWPIYLVAMVLSSNVGAIFTGEWRGTQQPAKVWMVFGLALLAVSIAIATVGSV